MHKLQLNLWQLGLPVKYGKTEGCEINPKDDFDVFIIDVDFQLTAIEEEKNLPDISTTFKLSC